MPFYDLAGAEHDVEHRNGAPRPRRSYLLCSNPRSGSTLLSEALHHSGRLGTPIEYFDGTDTMMATAQRWGCRNLHCYIRCLHRHRTTPDGVLGGKIHWYQLQEVTIALQPQPLPGPYGAERALLERTFPGCTYVYIVRRDVERQAVSWAIAEATGLWTDMGNVGTPPPVPYDFDAIDHCRRRLEWAESGWRGLFAALGVEPMTVTYEELADDYPATVARVASHLGVDLKPSELPAPRLRRQSNPRTDAMVERYRRERADGRVAPPSPRGVGLFGDAHPNAAASAAVNPEAFAPTR